jgi:hypothetical protein
MRKVLALLLLAGVSSPALAAADPGDTARSHANREARQEARAEARTERSGGNDRQHSNNGGGGDHTNNAAGPPPQQQQQQQAVVHVETGGGGNSAEHRFHNGVVNRISSGDQPGVQPTAHENHDAPDSVRNWRAQERRSGGPKIIEPNQTSSENHVAPALREQNRRVPGVFRNRIPVVSNVPHEGTQPPLRAESRSRDRDHHWNTSWRNDHRYDWNDWRRHHRSIFHLGFYYDPFGWNYRPYQIGWRLWPNYYSSSYWINNPYDYRLPYAPPGYRWIRYWDDAILVDTFTGEVVDVINNFFW